MVTRVHFIVGIADTIALTDYVDILKDLETIPEVKSVDRIRGTGCLRVQVETPESVASTTDKLKALAWTKYLYMLKVELQPREHESLDLEALLKPMGAIPA